MATTKYKQKVKFAATPVVQAHIDAWSEATVQCRSWRHSWEPLSGVMAPAGMAAEIQQCRRCTATRYRLLEAKTGKIVDGWTPSLPEGYSMNRGSGRIAGHTFDMVRLAALKSTKPTVVKSSDFFAELQKIVKGG